MGAEGKRRQCAGAAVRGWQWRPGRERRGEKNVALMLKMWYI